jgi:hypothetical protein
MHKSEDARERAQLVPMVVEQTLNVGRNNHGTRAHYERLGFIAAKEFRGKFNGHDVDVITLRHDKPQPKRPEDIVPGGRDARSCHVRETVDPRARKAGADRRRHPIDLLAS